MRVTGFTFIRNAIQYDYPIVEAISSILPLCDDFVVAVGNSSDETLALIQGIGSSKIRIIQTVWDDHLREGGRVLALETDKAFAAIDTDTDWCFYIQGDEVLHESYHKTVREAMSMYLDNPEVEGLLFKYAHFYGSYDYIATASRWYRNEIRIIRNDRTIYSFRDAQGFRKGENQKLRVKAIDATIYHYGWVRPPDKMQHKQRDFQRLWHSDAWIDNNIQNADQFDYSGIDRLERFTGTHPAVMKDRIKRLNWSFNRDISTNRKSWKDRIKDALREYAGLDFSYKNYTLLK
jgi:hypothetical protein